MLRSTCFALLAFACLFSSGNSDQDVWRDIRNAENQALAQSVYNEYASSTGAPQYIAPTTPLLSPGLVAGAAALAAPASGYPSARVPGNVDVAASDAIARNILSFAQNLMQTLNTSYRKTTIFSPLSITSALALLLLGAKGRSYSELMSVFGQNDVVKLHEQLGLLLQDVQQPTLQTTSPQRQLDAWHSNSKNRSLRNYANIRNSPPEVHVANGLFLQTGLSLNPNYRQALTQVYKSDVQILDFVRTPSIATVSINNWVAEQTRGKIQNILSEQLDRDTRIILANALYFKAMWEIDFLGGATRVENFYPNGEGSHPAVPVNMMFAAGSFPYYEDPQLNCRIVGLPYYGNLSTMYIIQPMKSSIEQLAYLEQRLNADTIEYMISQMVRLSTIVAFPKLHLTETLQLGKFLQKMNIGGIFTPVQDDLSLITANEVPSRATAPRGIRSNGLESLQNLEAQRQAAPKGPTQRANLIVTEILHKVDFVVDEKGTEAAAASAAILHKSGPEIVFRTDTPFMLLVRHDLTKLPLFYGIINEPPTAKAGQPGRPHA